MVLVPPEILAEVYRLSFAAQSLGLLLGLALWVTGWVRRSFWIALTVTAGFGLWGLHLGRMSGSHPLVAAIMMGLAAGFMSMELGRLLAFVTGGLGTALVLTSYVPTFPEPLLAYLAGGLLCALLFKVWVTAVFGYAGTMVIIGCSAPLLARFARFNVLQIAAQRPALLNVAVFVGTGLGMVLQHRFGRIIETWGERKKQKAMDALDEKERAAVAAAKPAPAKPRLWGLMKPKQVA